MRSYNHFRKALTLGTGLTALFLVLRCSVNERDYSPLGIGRSGGGGAGGASGDGSGGTSAGQAGSSGSSGSGGQGGGTPIEPVPCTVDSNDAGSIDAGGDDDAGGIDAGSIDAGSIDAGSNVTSNDAGSVQAPCACVGGFFQAVDADGDGEGTRECSVAPGLDCDDGDTSVTHNGCGGCTDLPNEIGESCLDCGAYACDGPEALLCASKPDPLVDPDCQCQAGLIVARDTDADGQGTRLCEVNPGTDCNDGDDTFITNQCGGCESLPGSVGGACNECGLYACNGTALACVPRTGAAGRQCLNTTTHQTCIGTGFWGNNTTCPDACYQGRCEVCLPGTFRCTPYATGDLIQECVTDVVYVGSSSSSSIGIGWSDSVSCDSAQTCNVNNGTCTSYLLLPRDRTFDVAPLLERGGLPWHDVLNTAADSDYA